ncbi:hypothetical protein GCK32_000772 [Trichostrongylus colubriformis]|uniref:Uncharacterized protein n=1 Tax=Trichostrongylus colubriformis TaxID=6319 RepID=A0AAN8IZC6_TRICO
MWVSAVLLLAVVLPTLAKYGVVSKRSYAVSYGNGQLCNTGLFTSYSDQATCPCGPIILCVGCPTGCCCPTSTPVVYPPPPPISEGVTSNFLSLATTLSTAVLLFYIA